MVFTDYNTKFLDEAGVNHLIKELKEYMSGIATGDIDLSSYVTKEELQAKLDALDIDIDLSSYATKEEMEQAISGIDLSSYALKTEIPSLEGYATTEYVDNAIANVPSGGTTDLSNYYTKEETDALIPSTEGLATEEYVSTAISSIPTTDLSNYYNKDETYSKTEVDTLVANGGGTTTTPTDTSNAHVYSTEEIAIGTWIDGSTIYRKVFTVDLPAVQSGAYYNGTSIIPAPCGIMLINWRAICYGGLSTNETYWYPNYYFSGDGLKGTEIWTNKTSASTIGQTIDKNKFSVFHPSNPKKGALNVYYGSSFANKRCDFILEYIKVGTE